jgi:hypothetical protein
MLRFSPYAYAKLMHFRDKGVKDRIEVACWGRSSKDDLTLVEDVHFTKQDCSMASFDMCADDVNDYQMDMLDAGYQPFECTRILIHTHPGTSNTPSGVDESNFDDFFDDCGWHWGIMCILATDNTFFCRLRSQAPNVFPVICNGHVSIDWDCPYDGTDEDAWDEEYATKINKRQWIHVGGYQKGGYHGRPNQHGGRPSRPYEWADSEYYDMAYGDGYDIDSPSDITVPNVDAYEVDRYTLMEPFDSGTVPVLTTDGYLKKSPPVQQRSKTPPTLTSRSSADLDGLDIVISDYDGACQYAGDFVCRVGKKYLNYDGSLSEVRYDVGCTFDTKADIRDVLETCFHVNVVDKSLDCETGRVVYTPPIEADIVPDDTIDLDDYDASFQWNALSPADKSDIAAFHSLTIAEAEQYGNWEELANDAGFVIKSGP